MLELKVVGENPAIERFAPPVPGLYIYPAPLVTSAVSLKTAIVTSASVNETPPNSPEAVVESVYVIGVACALTGIRADRDKNKTAINWRMVKAS
jgi:hypothetical protein